AGEIVRERVREEARKLVAERYLLEEDVETVVSACAERYDEAWAVTVPSRVTVGD
ncbi:MAG: hypothetical protein IH956_04725, partial [Chloroflexi bacterium]|nr:hypothetical protein [Chloroflexota bacterium]